MKPVTHIRSRTVVLPHENIDTDRIIPARFLTTTERTGLGKALFNDWRYRADGTPDPEFALNKPQAKGCESSLPGAILVVVRRASTRLGRCSTSAFAPCCRARSPTSSAATR